MRTLARDWRMALALAALLTAPLSARSGARLKDVASLEGIAATPLIGYGLVVGLNKTGDRRQTIFSTQSLVNMLERLGVSVPAGQVKIENIAAVLVTAELPAYARAGARIDVTASSVGDARSLQGGTLLATPLRGPEGQVYALAQGPLSIGGFGGGGGGNSVAVNHLTVGRVPSGALVQVASAMALPSSDTLALSLREPDFVSASRVARAVNDEMGGETAKVLDPGTVLVRVPEQYKGAVADLMARIETLPVDTDAPARVVINERSGTVVVGGAVRLGPAAVAHGNLSVRISTKFEVSQPAPLSRGGDTAIVPNVDVDVREQSARLVTLEDGTTLDAVVGALNALGATPRDIIAIMQALKAAGALRADIVIL
ncbi:MAG: flagellar basal body P-ring protein FlgI [Acidobacteria bacterium]|nr:flagellar basal body P-ring protein FlgI [Acidobacteriota bacterium]HQZ37913.1 flagellar basal body P-ring protein FlgI [Vicinamibacterales bacterium]